MEDFTRILDMVTKHEQDMEEMKELFVRNLRGILYGTPSEKLDVNQASSSSTTTPPTTPSAQPKKKRVKRLPSLTEVENENASLVVVRCDEKENVEPINSTTTTTDDEPKATKKSSIANRELMPPPAVYSANASILHNQSQQHSRPQRAAKLKVVNSLKEAKLNSKLRRPDNEDVIIKLEHEQRVSQMHLLGEMAEVSKATNKKQAAVSKLNPNTSASTVSSDNSSVHIITEKIPVLTISSDDDGSSNPQAAAEPDKSIERSLSNESSHSVRELRVRVKRENLSTDRILEEENATVAFSAADTTEDVDHHETSNAKKSQKASKAKSTADSKAAGSKRNRKKKNPVPIPIKVERLSEIEDGRPLRVTRARQRAEENASKHEAELHMTQKDKEQKDESVYEEATNNMPENITITHDSIATMKAPIPTKTNDISQARIKVMNETVTIPRNNVNDGTIVLGAAPADATFCTAINQTVNQNATISKSLTKETSQPLANMPADATFNLERNQDSNASPKSSLASTNRSMETARDTLQPSPNSLITEDESFDNRTPVPAPRVQPQPSSTRNVMREEIKAMTLPHSSGKGAIPKLPYKMPSRTHELFNPSIASPVKKRVEAFEQAAAKQQIQTSASRLRPRPGKDNHGTGVNTPNADNKSHLTAGNRFLTPTQASTMPNPCLQGLKKQVASSASKAMSLVKTNLKSTAPSSSSKTLSRENSADDFRKGLHQLAEERKKQREQKHLQVAQQRELKERERIERLAKTAKEREDKRLKKQQEAEEKKRQLEAISKALAAEEEAAAEAARLKSAQERERLLKMQTSKKAAQSQQQQYTKYQLEHMKFAKYQLENLHSLQQQQLFSQNGGLTPKQQYYHPQGVHTPTQKQTPSSGTKPATIGGGEFVLPLPKMKYDFQMLHEDDSTDDEGKTSYKRPPPPTWSRSHVRGAAILLQQYMPSKIVDNFFSVKPMTPDLKKIFPNIDEKDLKRNSSVFWSTPPRYSQLQKP